MSQLVATMRKFKLDNLNGIQKHNQREISNHSNPDIDVSKAYLNYDLVNENLINYRDVTAQIIDSQKTSTRATRKDAVIVSEWLISSDRDFFKNLHPIQIRQYFKESLDFFKSRYGHQNIVYATVHLDETTPHMHVGVVPMKDGKLSAKTLFDRQELRYVQDELPVRLNSAGFDDIERGTKGSQRKKLTVREYKGTMREVEDLKKKRDRLIEQSLNMPNFDSNVFKQEVEEVRKGFFGTDRVATGRYIVDSKDLDHVKQTALAIDVLKETIIKQENKIKVLLNNNYQFDRERATLQDSIVKKEQENELLKERLAQSEINVQQANEKALESQGAYKNLESKTLNLFNSFSNYPTITHGVYKAFKFDLMNVSPFKLLNWILSEPQNKVDDQKMTAERKQEKQNRNKNNQWDLSR